MARAGYAFAPFVVGTGVYLTAVAAHAAPPPAGAENTAKAAPAAAAVPAAPEPEEEAIEPTTLDPLSRMADLEARLEQVRSVAVGRQPRVVVGGYIDLGFFATQGNGSGIVRDNGNTLFPQYAGQYGWLFLGDILATAVNSRGEAADLGDATGAGERYDSIHSGGAPSFIANEVNLTLTSGLGESAIATASVNFLPRSGNRGSALPFSIGDFLDVDIAQLEWMPTKSQRTSIFVGKFDSVLGIEYRERKSHQRFGITPSLIARYTTGTALGLKMRSKFGPDDLLVIAGSVTNGSFTTEQFHFYNEVDTNLGKTASGRLSLHPPLSVVEMELGVSGSYGSQDRATTDTGAMWFWGVDFQLHADFLDFKAQYLRGQSPGAAPDVYGLKLHHGGYAELDAMVTPVLGLMARFEVRDAFVWLTDNRAYLTKSWRGTAGLRLVLSERVLLKAEYLRNGEYGGIPEIANDVFTTSLVLIN